MEWYLAIDFGTTSTAAARRIGDRIDIVQFHGAPRLPSTAFWREGSGEASAGRLVLGEEAEEMSTLAPWCLERTPKSRLGEEFIQLGEKQIRPVEIVAAIYREAHEEAVELSGGEPPSEVRLTHPARWRDARLERLRQAATLAGIDNPTFVAEPVAAAMHFGSERLEDGEHVAVYDLGGGTLDTAVLKRVGDGFEVAGRPGGNEELGGEDFDDLLYRHLGEMLPGETWSRLRQADEDQDRDWGHANRDLRRQARKVKERLSRRPTSESYLSSPINQELEVTKDAFERLITPMLRGTVSELERTVLAAGIAPGDLSAVYLAGGSSRIPLVSRLIEEELGIAPEHLDDPKAVIALGAVSRRTAAVSTPIPPLPVEAAEPEPVEEAAPELDETEIDGAESEDPERTELLHASPSVAADFASATSVDVPDDVEFKCRGTLLVNDEQLSGTLRCWGWRVTFDRSRRSVWSAPFDSIEAVDLVRDAEPGELVQITADGGQQVLFRPKGMRAYSRAREIAGALQGVLAARAEA